MKKLKNSKYRNTGFIFEVLIRNVTTEAMNNEASKSLGIIKKYFNKDSELLKEFQLYKSLSEPNKKESISDKLIDAVKDLYKDVDPNRLRTEKYKLIGDLNKKYNIKEFFNTRVEKYPIYANIYKVLNYDIKNNPEEYLKTKELIKEYITAKPIKKIEDTEDQNLLTEQVETKIEAAYVLKLAVKKFNEKYASFSENQKNILSKYMNENTSSESFLRFLQLEANKQKNQLKEIIKNKVKDPVQKIKLQELTKLLETIELSKKVKDDHVSALLKYSELISLLVKK